MKDRTNLTIFLLSLLILFCGLTSLYVGFLINYTNNQRNDVAGVNTTDNALIVTTVEPTPSLLPTYSNNPIPTDTVMPTTEPTVKPTIKPTNQPTNTPEPTSTPTSTPSPTPTMTPTPVTYADLIVKDAKYSVTSANVFKFSYQIFNQGKKASGAHTNSIRILNGYSVENRVTNLNPGEGKKFEISMNLSNGDKSVIITADVKNEVSEGSNENNNTKRFDLKVYPDFVISNLKAYTDLRDMTFVEYEVKNIGVAKNSGNFNVELIIIPNDNSAPRYRTVCVVDTKLGINGTYKCKTVVGLQPGSYVIIANADCDRKEAELNENNNSKSINYRVGFLLD